MPRFERDPAGFIADLLRQGGTITLPDGTVVPKLPFIVRWMWDGDFCGSISLRWQTGTDALPPHVLGHIGYAVVPWKRGRGYASEALRLMLIEARSVGLGRRRNYDRSRQFRLAARHRDATAARSSRHLSTNAMALRRTFAMLST